MNSLPKEQVSPDTYHPKLCPNCNRPSFNMAMFNNSGGLWYMCSCGVAFNSDYKNTFKYNLKYKNELIDTKEYEYRVLHPASVYAPIIEDMTLGRKILDVGCNDDSVKKYMNDRGWIYFGIDINEDMTETNRLVKGDFEVFNFEENKFNVIWLNNVLECFNDPILSLKKCYDLLAEDGILYICTPDTDFINNVGYGSWIHWDAEQHNICWNIRSLSSRLQAMGFDIILSRRNFATRYLEWQNIHIIAQKVFF